MLDLDKRRAGSAWIHSRLRDVGLSQQDVARRMSKIFPDASEDGLKSTLSRFINGTREMPTVKFVAFCTIIGVAPDVLLREMGYEMVPLPQVPVVGEIGAEGRVTLKHIGWIEAPAGIRPEAAYLVSLPGSLLHHATVFVGKPSKKLGTLMNRTCVYQRGGVETLGVLTAAAFAPKAGGMDVLAGPGDDAAPQEAAPVLFVSML